MGRSFDLPRRHAALLTYALALLSCADPARIASPRDHLEPNALADKQGTTSRRILYVAGFPSKVFSINEDGTGAIQLSPPGDWYDADAAWAPDGKRVLFAHSDQLGSLPLAIYAMNADGTGVTRLTNPPTGHHDFGARALGKRIVFVRSEAGSGRLWMMDEDGSNLTQLTDGPFDLSPAPSPGGKLVAFLRNTDIYVLDIETRAVTNLTNSAGQELTPSWSPGGKQIAFARLDLGQPNADLYVMTADGTEVTRLTTTPSVAKHSPRWSPDGKRIVFAGAYTGFFGVWLISADGTGLNNVTQSDVTSEIPTAWAR